ncbi:MAG: hypothetical protein QXD86_02770 [Candidatus Bathyarchaeia archaeon]
MQSERDKVRVGREKLHNIIETCKDIIERSLDPFIIDVDEFIEVLREYFSCWDQPEDLCLDAEALHYIASIIELQSEWIKSRSTSLYKDPFLLEDKIKSLSAEKILEIFLKTWHPIIELEQITIHSLAEALRYWKNLPPIKERWSEFPPPEPRAEPASREELIKEKILSEKGFSEELEALWNELKLRARIEGSSGKIRYWDFIGADTYNETIYRAYMTSFLVTYGYAELELHPLEMEIYVKPYRKQAERRRRRQQLISVPIAISYEDWRRWKEARNEQK